MTATAQLVQRTPSLIAQRGRGLLPGQHPDQAGIGRITQDDRTAVLHQGDFALYDSTRPYELRFDGDFQQYVLMLPGPTLRSQLGETRPVHRDAGWPARPRGRPPDDRDDPDAGRRHRGAGAGRGRRRGPGRGAHRGGRAELARRRDRSPEPTLEARAGRDQDLPWARLGDPEPSIAAMAAQLHTSVSTLHRAFAGEPASITEWIWAQRLDGIRRGPLRPGAAPPHASATWRSAGVSGRLALQPGVPRPVRREPPSELRRTAGR